MGKHLSRLRGHSGSSLVGEMKGVFGAIMTVDSSRRKRRQNELPWCRQPQAHARISVYLVSDQILEKVGVGRGQNLTLFVL